MTEYRYEEEIKQMTDAWKTEEMIELLAECEMALSYNEGRIKQLDVRGFKRLWNIISGIEARNKRSIRNNMHEIQKVSFEIQKILLERINLVDDMLISLNKKVNDYTLQTRFMIYKMLQKFEKQQKNIDIAIIQGQLLNWYYGITDEETEDGKSYLEVSDGMKILLVASDLFRIVHYHDELIGRAALKRALDELKLEKTISNSDFYSDVIEEKECRSLYIKDYFDYQAEDISPYGRMLYKIDEFYSNPLLDEVSEVVTLKPEELCWKVISKEIQKPDDGIAPCDLCMILLKDMEYLSSEFQKKMNDQVQSDEKFLDVDQCEEKDRSQCDEKDSNEAEYSILKMTPELLTLFNEKDQKQCKLDYDCAKDYKFKGDGILKAMAAVSNPQMIAVPTGFYTSSPEIADALSGKYVTLSDYYMYLWFCNTDEKERADKKLVFIEFYGYNGLYVFPYAVDASGDSYKKQEIGKKEKKESMIKIDATRACVDIIKQIRSNIFSEPADKNSILIYQTFYSRRHNLFKFVDNLGVKMVDERWEDVLKEKATREKMIRDLFENPDIRQ